MAEPRRRMPWMMRPRQGAMQQRRPGWSPAMPSQGRTPGRGWFPSATGRRGATAPAGFARGRRGAATIPPDLGARGFTRDKTDTGGMRKKPGWALMGWFRIPIIGPWIEALANMVFKYRRFEETEQQSVGFSGKKGRLVPAEGPEMTPQDMLDLTHGTGKFAQHGARQGAARNGTGRRTAMQGQRAIAGQRSAGRRQMKQAA